MLHQHLVQAFRQRASAALLLNLQAAAPLPPIPAWASLQGSMVFPLARIPSSRCCQNVGAPPLQQTLPDTGQRC